MSGQEQAQEAQERKRNVELTVTSETGGQIVRQHIQGVMFRKEDSLFYRYREPDEALGRAMTILKVERDSIKVIRQGDIQSEQTFVTGRSCAGFYATAHGRLPLETKTRKLSVNLKDGLGFLAWMYDLFAGSEPAGRFAVTIDIKPAAGAQER